MTCLEVATYNTYQEKNGRDPALEALLEARDTLAFLQEVSPRRALCTLRRFGDHAFVSPGRHGLQYLAIVLPQCAEFVDRRTVQLNGRGGMIPAVWSARRGYHLYRSGHARWRDCFEPRVAQAARLRWGDLDLRVVNTHLPLEAGLRNRSFARLADLLRHGNVLLAGDLNATRKNLFLNDLVLAEGLRVAGSGKATHDSGRRIDYVMYRGRLREVRYSIEEGLSDHRLLKVELEVLE